MRLGVPCWLGLLSCLVWYGAVSASRVAPADQQLLLKEPSLTGHLQQDSTASALAATDNKKKRNGSIDFSDEDPDVRAHWALLVAGSSGWYNYRHQADVFHAYQVLVAGGYRPDHIVVMAADDIAQDQDNPMPGKVFNRPGGPNVYDGVRIDYRGPDVTAENFLAVLLGDASAVSGKGTGRVVASGPHDKVFVFYSDHGAAGVLGMPNGPFLYADEFIKTLKKKHSRNGFKEAVLYIEACESGSMFEGLLGNDLDIYVTTAANAIESSWATYCPTFFGTNTNAAAAADNDGSSTAAAAAAIAAAGSNGGWKQQLLRGMAWLQQQLGRVTGNPQPSAAAAAAGGVKPSPEFTTCLGDLYSVAWMEDAESSDLTAETLLQQYKRIKVRTSQNFTYDQGSHVMQYGDLEIDKELSGDYEGSKHNGSAPTPSYPAQDWIDHAAAMEAQQQQQQQGVSAAAAAAAAVRSVGSTLQRYSSPEALMAYLQAGNSVVATAAVPSSPRSSAHSHAKNHHQQQQQQQQKHRGVEQRDADLVPLAVTAQRSACPRKRAAAAAALRKSTAARQRLEAAARAAAAHLLVQPATGTVLMSALGASPRQVLLQGAGTATGPHQQQLGQQPSLLLGDAAEVYVEALMGPLPGRAGGAVVGDWDCLRSMVKMWEGECGRLDQYGMKLTRLFSNLCNAGVQPQQLQQSLARGPCSGLP